MLTKRSLLCVALLALVALLVTAPAATARDCEARNPLTAWKHRDGSFRRVSNVEGWRAGPNSPQPTFVWKEYDNSQAEQCTFVEVNRDFANGQIMIEDPKRGMQLLLRGDLSAHKSTGDQQFQKLYSGGWMRVIDCS